MKKIKDISGIFEDKENAFEEECWGVFVNNVGHFISNLNRTKSFSCASLYYNPIRSLRNGNSIAKVSIKCAANDLVTTACSPPFPNQNLSWYKIKLLYKKYQRISAHDRIFKWKIKIEKFMLWKISIILWLNVIEVSTKDIEDSKTQK